MSNVWVNGSLVAREQATVSVFDHGLLYGDGVFEGIRFYSGQPFRLTAHLERLKDSADALSIELPYDLNTFEQGVMATIQDFDAVDGYIRLVVTRGEGKLGINPDSCAKPNVFIIADHLSLVDPEIKINGATVIVAATRRMPASALDPRIKSLNYLNNILALMEAKAANADEAILLNQAGNVAEGSADNLFLVKNNVLKTPRIMDGALNGITRGVVLEIAAEYQWQFEECALTPYDLYTADEVFLTGTGMELLPVGEIDGRKLPACPGNMFSTLSKKFADKITQETDVIAMQKIGTVN